MHGQGPKVLAVANIEARFDDVCDGREICASMGVDDTLGPGGCARSERDSEHGVLIAGLRVQAGPAVRAVGAIIGETLSNRIIKGAA